MEERVLSERLPRRSAPGLFSMGFGVLLKQTDNKMDV